MHLTRGADYGLRGMVYLARQPADKLVMANEIAAAENMPEYFFSKIFQNLAKVGLVNSFRGSNGGFLLAKPPAEITVREVTEAIEGPIAFSRCVNAPQTCEKSSTCPFHYYWKEAQQGLFAILEKYSLADAVSYIEAAEQRNWLSDT
ncbi:MAG: Rrf2 family transcriptional regulator [Candidatus Hydrogenedentota bacterium]|nr:MAG: Rrf2 family transcriptional regulator [Candidatus Hydrogenedentota bacterium]